MAGGFMSAVFPRAYSVGGCLIGALEARHSSNGESSGATKRSLWDKHARFLLAQRHVSLVTVGAVTANASAQRVRSVHVWLCNRDTMPVLLVMKCLLQFISPIELQILLRRIV